MKYNTWKWTLCLLALCFVAALFLLPGPAEAAAIVDSGECGDDLTWTLDSDGVLTVEGTGTMWDYSSQLDYDSWTFSTTAPWSGQFGSLKTLVIGSGVTSIGSYAFYNCSGLTSVSIPGSVTSIGDWAFRGCSGLTGVTIPEGVTSIGDWAFAYCSGLQKIDSAETNAYYCSANGVLFSKDGTTLVAYPAGKSGAYTIPEGVTSIGYSAFYGCSGLTSVTIPGSVTSIGDRAFSDCSGLTSITIPGSVTSTGDWAFYGCSGLTDVTIPEGVTSIGDSAFYGCSGLTGVTIPGSVTSIGRYAFSGCSGLTSVAIREGVTSIGDSAFSGCSGLTSITIPESVTSISEGAFYRCSGLISVTIPGSVTSIGDGAFLACSGLTSVVIPEGVTSIGVGAFNGCSGLTSVTIPESVTAIGGEAFDGCSGLTSVTIDMQTVPSAFSGMPSIQTVILGNHVESIGANAFLECSGLTSVTIPKSVTSIGDRAFFYCSGLDSVTLPESVVSIGMSAFEGTAFYNNSNNWEDHVLYLGSALIEASSRYVPEYVPENYSISIKEGTKCIADGAFEYCSTLTNVIIPNSVTSIGSGAFSHCHSLTSVTIPEGVTSIGERVFFRCSGLQKIDSAETNAYYSSANGVLFSKDGTTLVAYPAGKSGAYTIPEGVTSIGYSAFYGCSGLTSVAIREGVTSIGDYAFYDCSGLESVTIPESVVSIGISAFEETAFYKNSNNWEDHVLYLGSALIEASSRYVPENYSIKAGTKFIADYAFDYCRSLKSVTVPESVTSIGGYAFYACSGLNDVYYTASKSGWQAISIGDYNDPLLNATIHFLKTVQQITNEELTSTVTTVQDVPSPSGFASFTVTAEVEFEEELIPEGTTVRALCALTKGGRFVDVRIVEMEEGATEASFHFDGVDYDTVRLFFTDEDSAPVCDSLTL